MSQPLDTRSCCLVSVIYATNAHASQVFRLGPASSFNRHPMSLPLQPSIGLVLGKCCGTVKMPRFESYASI